MENLDAVVQEKLDADLDFQAELELLSDEEKVQVIADKKAELVRQEFEAVSAKAKQADDAFQDQKARAYKAEQELKKVAKPAGGSGDPKSSENYSLSDIRALSDVPEEDVDEVVKWAKYNNISVAEAKKSTVMQSLLKNRAEERKTADVTNTGGGRRAVSKNTDADILARADKGDLPESDDEIKRLSEARLAARLKAKGLE